MNKKYYDGIIIFDILAKHLDAKKMMEVLKAFADVKGVDAVEVIRCKDCKHFCNEEENYISEEGFAESECMYMPMARENDYCSHAERKEE